MTTQDQVPNEEPDITVDDACLILMEVASGVHPIDDEFIKACKLAIAALKESELFWP